MDLLPNELILLIVDELEKPKDKRAFSMISKKYFNTTKLIISNIKYAVFSTAGCYECYNKHDLKGIFDNLNYCREYIKKSLLKNPITYSSTDKMTKQNNYTLMAIRNDYEYTYHSIGRGFIIEEIILNNFDL